MLAKDYRDLNEPQNFVRRTPAERRLAAIYFLKVGAVAALYKRLAYMRQAEPGFVLDLSGADLSFASMWQIDLPGVNLRGADLRGADLRNAYLSGANLSHADLRGANLKGADLTNADLTGAVRGRLEGHFARIDSAAEIEVAENGGRIERGPSGGSDLNALPQRNMGGEAPKKGAAPDSADNPNPQMIKKKKQLEKTLIKKRAMEKRKARKTQDKKFTDKKKQAQKKFHDKKEQAADAFEKKRQQDQEFFERKKREEEMARSKRK